MRRGWLHRIACCAPWPIPSGGSAPWSASSASAHASSRRWRFDGNKLCRSICKKHRLSFRQLIMHARSNEPERKKVKIKEGRDRMLKLGTVPEQNTISGSGAIIGRRAGSCLRSRVELHFAQHFAIAPAWRPARVPSSLATASSSPLQ